MSGPADNRRRSDGGKAPTAADLVAAAKLLQGVPPHALEAELIGRRRATKMNRI